MRPLALLPSLLVLTSTTSTQTPSFPACGDGTLAGEACDDANHTDADGCSADCSDVVVRFER